MILPLSGWVFLMPDMAAGIAALYVVGLSDAIDGGTQEAAFIQVYGATVLEALMVSGSIYILFLTGVGLFQIIKNRRLVKVEKESVG